MIKITYIIDNLEVGGAQVHLSGLVKGISAGKGYDMEIVSLGGVSESIRKAIRDDIPIVVLKMESARKPVFFGSMLQLVLHLRRRRPDIVHTYLNTSNVFGLAAARIAFVGKIVTSRRDMGQFRSGRIGALERGLSRRYAARVFCVCKAVAERTRDVEGIPGNKIRVLLNGVDASCFQPRKEYHFDNGNPMKFGMVATMNRVEKGHGELIEAASWASSRAPGKMEFLLAGDGPLRRPLEDISTRLGTSDCVRFQGEQGDIDSFLEGVDVLVVPSYSEGISNAVLEAMAKGLPVIATAVDGNLETVVDGHTGILVPPRDPQALGEAFLAYVCAPGLAEAHGRSGRKRAEESFSMSRMIEAYRREYGSLVTEG